MEQATVACVELDFEIFVDIDVAAVVDPIAPGVAIVLATKASMASLALVSPVVCVEAVTPFGSAGVPLMFADVPPIFNDGAVPVNPVPGPLNCADAVIVVALTGAFGSAPNPVTVGAVIPASDHWP